MGWLSSLVGGVVGGLFGRSGDKKQAEATRQANELNAQLNRENQQLQREFAQQGIRWKVEDAKAAGLHPLFALGGAGATYTPSAIPMMADSQAGSYLRDMGQNVSRAAAAFDPEEQAIQQAQLRALNAAADKDFATASAMNSEAARNLQAMRASIPPVAESFPITGGGRQLVPNSLESTVSSIQERDLPPTAGLPDYITNNVGTLFTRFNTPWGELLLPSEQAAQSLEALESLIGSYGTVAGNVKHYPNRKMPKAWSDPWGAAVDYARSKVPQFIRR
jgi:hypothetical protein